MNSNTKRVLVVQALLFAIAFLPAYGDGTGIPVSGTIVIGGTVSRFVELTSGGAPTISGNSAGGSATLNGGANSSALSVSIDLGEVGPSNGSPFVVAIVPLRLRSNTPYVLSAHTVSFTNAGGSDIAPSDIGFGLADPSRSGPGTSLGGSETMQNSGNPTTAPNGLTANGRYVFAGTNGHLGSLTGLTQVMSGPRILTPVPRAGAGSLTVNAMFAVKPQFYSTGTFSSVVDFVLSAP